MTTVFHVLVTAGLEQHFADVFVTEIARTGKSKIARFVCVIDVCVARDQELDCCFATLARNNYQLCVAIAVLFVDVRAKVDAVLELLDVAILDCFDDVALLVFRDSSQSGRASLKSDGQNKHDENGFHTTQQNAKASNTCPNDSINAASSLCP